MKWVLIIVAVLIVGWQVAVFLTNRGDSENVSHVVTDSLQAKQPAFANGSIDSSRIDNSKIDSTKDGEEGYDTILKKKLTLPGSIDTKGANPDEVVRFAKTLLGVPYLYGSASPEKGFDCSGFITYVFKKFDIVVPRSSIDFTHVGKEVSAASAKPGDLILFTGTDSLEKFVGHMGIVVSNTDSLHFIHSTSGKLHSVTITPLNKYYQGRYVKTIRIFPQNG